MYFIDICKDFRPIQYVWSDDYLKLLNTKMSIWMIFFIILYQYKYKGEIKIFLNVIKDNIEKMKGNPPAVVVKRHPPFFFRFFRERGGGFGEGWPLSYLTSLLCNSTLGLISFSHCNHMLTLKNHWSSHVSKM